MHPLRRFDNVWTLSSRVLHPVHCSRIRVFGASSRCRRKPRRALAGRSDLSINHALTGAAFPCLDVNVSEGNERGYAILRPPFAASDLILAPTRKIVGVEDPSLQASDAPNYFEDAWNAHRLLQDALQKPVARDEIVLAVNSRQARTQDQLHIHIGCLTAAARQTVRAFAPALPESRWVPLGRPFHGLEFWGAWSLRKISLA